MKVKIPCVHAFLVSVSLLGACAEGSTGSPRGSLERRKDDGTETAVCTALRTVSESELLEKVFYEGFLSLNSLLFLIEINNMSEGAVKNMLNQVVIPARKYISRRVQSSRVEDVLRAFRATATSVSYRDRDLQALLVRRNRYFDGDDSQIARNLYREDLAKLEQELRHGNFQGAGNTQAEALDRKYTRMVLALRTAIIEGGNLAQSIKRERGEFIKEFGERPRVTTREVAELKALINLGGAIFEPGLLLQLVSKIAIGDKPAFVEKNVLAILKPVEELEFSVRHKPNVEKKDCILAYLRACHTRQQWIHKNLLDDAFRARTEILEAYLKPEREDRVIDKERAFDRHHERFLIDIINRTENLKDELFERFLVINQDITSTYVRLLQTGKQSLARTLLRAF